jgi:hypothetical protein
MHKYLFIIALALSTILKAERIPNTSFGIFPLFGSMTNTPGYTDDQVNTYMIELKNLVGENRGLFKVGFGGIMGSEARLEQVCKLSKQNNLSHITILGIQTHAIPSTIKTIANNDLRNYQWRKDGTSWNGVAGGENRDVDVVTPSRYATELRNEFIRLLTDKVQGILRVMAKYPEVILGVNASIEMGLADATTETRMADYSPFAVTEFRDWLLHRGKYDATTGTYPTEGALSAIVGDYIQIDGKLRSQFYDDPSPNDANGTGVSFNSKFGTNFTTWSLKYWDLTLFNSKITDTAFDITPTSGTGYTEGGFEAPRTKNTANAFWNAWTYDLVDHGNVYPAGNPSNPAFGFRQVMVRNFVNDILYKIQELGIPSNMITAHQIPSEMLTTAYRQVNLAEPIWTGLSKFNGTVGITRYGSISSSQLSQITQYTNSWGIYEWHPQKSPTDNADLKARTKSALTNFYNANCRFLCPFTWTNGTGGLPGGASLPGLYPVKDCGFSWGIKEWLNEQPDYVNPTSLLKNQSAFQNSFDIIPNPASNNFKIKTSSADLKSISISNTLGEIVYALAINAGSQNNEYFVDSNFASGVYLVSLVDTKNSVRVAKLVVK